VEKVEVLRPDVNMHTPAQEGVMKLIESTTLALVAVCAVSLAAQSETTKTKSKVKVDGGNEITVAGCMERNPAGGYMLTDGSTHYSLVGGKGLDKHVGHRIEVKGKTTDGGHGKVKIESKTKSSKSETTEDKAEIKGDVHAIGVKSVKMIASSCA
jgi:hypothetical protein